MLCWPVEISTGQQSIRFGRLRVSCGSDVKPEASIELEVDGVVQSAVALGDGPVDATFAAIGKIVPHEAALQLFSINAVTEGIDAQAVVSVKLAEGGKSVNGQASDVDIIVASARAYLNALNKLVQKRGRTAPPTALSA
mgnify:CR=1 FL=1